MTWDFGTGVLALLVVLAVLVAIGLRNRPDRRRSGTGDGAQVWMTGDTGSRRADADDPGKGVDAGTGSDSGGGGGTGD